MTSTETRTETADIFRTYGHLTLDQLLAATRDAEQKLDTEWMHPAARTALIRTARCLNREIARR